MKFFSYRKVFSRSEDIIEVFKNEYENCSEQEKLNIAYKYLQLLCYSPYDIWTIRGQTFDQYYDYVNSILTEHEFEENERLRLYFCFNKLNFEHYIGIHLDEGIAYFNNMIDIAYNNQSVVFTSICCKRI